MYDFTVWNLLLSRNPREKSCEIRVIITRGEFSKIRCISFDSNEPLLRTWEGTIKQKTLAHTFRTVYALEDIHALWEEKTVDPAESLSRSTNFLVDRISRSHPQENPLQLFYNFTSQHNSRSSLSIESQPKITSLSNGTNQHSSLSRRQWTFTNSSNSKTIRVSDYSTCTKVHENRAGRVFSCWRMLTELPAATGAWDVSPANLPPANCVRVV